MQCWRAVHFFWQLELLWTRKGYPRKKKKKQKIRRYPQQHAMLFVVLAPPRSLRRISWNPRGTLVEPWWNPRVTLPQGRPGPPRCLSGLRPRSFQLLGRKKEKTRPGQVRKGIVCPSKGLGRRFHALAVLCPSASKSCGPSIFSSLDPGPHSKESCLTPRNINWREISCHKLPSIHSSRLFDRLWDVSRLQVLDTKKRPGNSTDALLQAWLGSTVLLSTVCTGALSMVTSWPDAQPRKICCASAPAQGRGQQRPVPAEQDAQRGARV